MPPGRNDDDDDRASTSTLPGSPHPGVLPVVPPGTDGPSRSNAATAASAAGVRALSAQAIAFYFRAPVKAFFRTRVDYLAYARSVHQAQHERLSRANRRAASSSRLGLLLRQTWLWARGTTPGLLTSVVRQHGWRVIPDQILPPLVANVSVGAVLYTSYLQILGRLHEGGVGATSARRVYPPPHPAETFAAGFLAGSLQSVVAAPLDAIQARYDHRDLVAAGSENGRPRSLWSFSAEKLREIGVRGIFAGWGLSFVKDSCGSAIFFSAFEYVKAQSYYKFITWYYGGLDQDVVDLLARKRPSAPSSQQHRRDGPGLLLRTDMAGDDSSGDKGDHEHIVIRPHYAIEPMFLLLAGIGASFAQQLLLHPLSHIQVKHWDHLEDLDAKAARLRDSSRTATSTSASASVNPDQTQQQSPRPHRRWRMLRAYYHAYQETWAYCTTEAASQGRSPLGFLYRGFWWNTVRQVPSTSAGLIIFELVRRKYGLGGEEVRITTDDYHILLN
ncbi:hypothetical protein SLS62_001727 [Diatrype stigma]|uniref:Mitochondrial carrier protein n=1 Tax=Diatrype stigma TaxID=117547 RepID=A0AAN9UVC4_9PEZI